MAPSFGSVGARDGNAPLLAASSHAHTPRVAADFAVLDERAADVGLDVDLDLLAAVGTGDEELGSELIHLPGFREASECILN